MKTNGLLIVLSFLLFACTTQNEFSFSGTISGDAEGLVYLMDREDGKWIAIDSSEIVDGVFSFNGTVNAPVIYYLKTDAIGRNFFPVFMENSNMNCNIKLSPEVDYTIEGSSTHLEFDLVNDDLDVYKEEMDAIYQQYRTASSAFDTIRLNELLEQYDAKDEEQNQFILAYANDNPESYVAPYMVARYSFSFDEMDLEPIVNNFDESIMDSKYAIQLKERLDLLKRVAIGQAATDFEQELVDGQMLKLSSLYGTYLLVDFWASWCGPCRAENPNLVKNYRVFHKKGFDILGVSFDDNREKWLKAISDDELSWLQVSDLEGWGNAAGKLYGIRSIPSNILLDPDGVIIAKNIRGDDLNDKLQEIFGE